VTNWLSIWSSARFRSPYAGSYKRAYTLRFAAVSKQQPHLKMQGMHGRTLRRGTRIAAPHIDCKSLIGQHALVMASKILDSTAAADESVLRRRMHVLLSCRHQSPDGCSPNSVEPVSQ
jgi:hypothetical protein